MATEICKQAFLGYHFFGEERKRNGEGEIYRLTNNSGKGKISCYDVCEGILGCTVSASKYQLVFPA